MIGVVVVYDLILMLFVVVVGIEVVEGLLCVDDEVVVLIDSFFLFESVMVLVVECLLVFIVFEEIFWVWVMLVLLVVVVGYEVCFGVGDGVDFVIYFEGDDVL